jgi:hypothetical protein
MTYELPFGNEPKPKRGRPPANQDISTSESPELIFDAATSAPDLKEVRRLRELAQAVVDNGHVPEKPLSSREFKRSLDITSPNMNLHTSKELVRLEEIEADLVRTKGRYIPNVDDVKPGVPFSSRVDERVSHLDGQTFAVPLISTLNINSDGITIRGGGIFDPGEGAQKKPDFTTIKSANPHDPSSESFTTCSNKLCPYREGCLRYRLKNRRINTAPFFPEQCRKDGIYISINDTSYSGFDPFDQIERGSSGLTSLPNPN